MRPRLSRAALSPAAVVRRTAELSPVRPTAVLELTGRSVRGGWNLAARAYDLFSPVALGPRVPGVVGLLTVGADEGSEPSHSAVGGRGASRGNGRGRGSNGNDGGGGGSSDGGGTESRLADPILWLEGETGARVATAFLVENERPDAVSASIEISAFAGPGGSTAAPVLTVTPSILDLGPGEQALVQVAAVLGPELEADVRYVGRISIPGLSAVSVPIAARRRVAEAA